MVSNVFRQNIEIEILPLAHGIEKRFSPAKKRLPASGSIASKVFREIVDSMMLNGE